MQPEPPQQSAADAPLLTQGGPEANDSTQGRPESNPSPQAAPESRGTILVRGDSDGSTSEPQRTSPKIIIIHALTIRGLREAVPGLIAAFAWLGISGGLRSFGIAGIIGVLAAAIIGLAAVNWYRFTYQVANRQLIIAQGIFSRRVRTIPVDRIRAIERQVSPLHRILGLARLKIEAAAAGTGNEEAELDGLPFETALALRESLLRARRRPTRIAGPGGVSAEGQPGWTDDLAGRSDEQVQDIEYCRSRASWLLYAPLVGSYLALPVAAVGFLSQFIRDLPESWLSWINLDPTTITAGQVTLLVLTGLVLLALGSVIGAVILNWRFRLLKRGDLLISERGLLTRRTVSIEIARIRGYTLSEGLGMRVVRAARLTALITGVSAENTRTQLLPLGPYSEAIAIANRAVRRFDAPLRRHPIAALRRRLVRSVLPGAAVLVIGLLIGVLVVATAGAVLTGFGMALGIDRYRSLGHASDGEAFAVRSGSLVRHTILMERRALVGWKVRQSFFQGRAGLSTVTALVGAGVGAYAALDIGDSEGLDLAVRNGGRWARELLPH